MLVIPAIDIKNGKCVRLVQGDPERETIYSDDPVAMALEFQRLGARLIHVVDLDGAFEGRPVNIDLVMLIQKSLTIPIESAGGYAIPTRLKPTWTRVSRESSWGRPSWRETRGPSSSGMAVLSSPVSMPKIRWWRPAAGRTFPEWRRSTSLKS